MNDDELIATLRQQLEQKDVLLALRATEIKTLYARIATIEGQPWEVIETNAPTNAEMSAIIERGWRVGPPVRHGNYVVLRDSLAVVVVDNDGITSADDETVYPDTITYHLPIPEIEP